MLTGTELGAAIAAAIKAKRVTKKAVAEVFGVKPPSVQGWISRGTISKAKLPDLWRYFSDVAGPEHWGLASFPRPINTDKRIARAVKLMEAMTDRQLDQAIRVLDALAEPLPAERGNPGDSRNG